MSTRKRQRIQSIEDLVQEQGSMSVGDLAEQMGVSMQTIRRDVAVLCDGEVLRRRHGHVEIATDNLNTPFGQRAASNASGKKHIGEMAASKIPDGASLFMSIGSTPLAVAKALHRHKDLTVITNNLNAAMALSAEQSNRIIVPGGELRLPDCDILGDEVLDFFGRYRVEFGIFGVAGVSDDGRLLDFHLSEVRVRERIVENSQRSMLLLDHSKFGRIAPVVGGQLSEIDTVILDKKPDASFDSLLEACGPRLIVAEPV